MMTVGFAVYRSNKSGTKIHSYDSHLRQIDGGNGISISNQFFLLVSGETRTVHVRRPGRDGSEPELLFRFATSRWRYAVFRVVGPSLLLSHAGPIKFERGSTPDRGIVWKVPSSF